MYVYISQPASLQNNQQKSTNKTTQKSEPTQQANQPNKPNPTQTQTETQPTNQPTNQPTKRPTDRPTDRPTNQPTNTRVPFQGIFIYLLILVPSVPFLHHVRAEHPLWLPANSHAASGSSPSRRLKASEHLRYLGPLAAPEGF